jgi:hypothetical protein
MGLKVLVLMSFDNAVSLRDAVVRAREEGRLS